MYLLDTNVVSELRKPRPHGAVLAWLQPVADTDLFLSAVTIGEIQAGIEITRENDRQKASEIERWLDQVTDTFSIISLDSAIFRTWAKFMHRKSDHMIEDALIAATAAVNGLTVVTRNVRDFERFGVKVVDPFRTI
jgi:toxin FitB